MAFDFAADQPVDLLVNGIEKFRSSSERWKKQGCLLEEERAPAHQGKSKDEPMSTPPALASAG